MRDGPRAIRARGGSPSRRGCRSRGARPAGARRARGSPSSGSPKPVRTVGMPRAASTAHHRQACRPGARAPGASRCRAPCPRPPPRSTGCAGIERGGQGDAEVLDRHLRPRRAARRAAGRRAPRPPGRVLPGGEAQRQGGDRLARGCWSSPRPARRRRGRARRATARRACACRSPPPRPASAGRRPAVGERLGARRQIAPGLDLLRPRRARRPRRGRRAGGRRAGRTAARTVMSACAGVHAPPRRRGRCGRRRPPSAPGCAGRPSRAPRCRSPGAPGRPSGCRR